MRDKNLQSNTHERRAGQNVGAQIANRYFGLACGGEERELPTHLSIPETNCHHDRRQQDELFLAKNLLGELVERGFSGSLTIDVNVVRKVTLANIAMSGNKGRSTLRAEASALETASNLTDGEHSAVSGKSERKQHAGHAASAASRVDAMSIRC